MKIAVELLLDPITARTFQELRRRIVEEHLLTDLLDAGTTPHMTLAVYDRLDVDEAREMLRSWIKRASIPDVQLVSVGTFPTDEGAVFFSPLVSEALLAVHEDFHATFNAWRDVCSSHYLPGSWFPHCTVVNGLPTRSVGGAIDVCREARLPSRSSFTQLAIVEFRPVTQLLVLSL